MNQGEDGRQDQERGNQDGLQAVGEYGRADPAPGGKVYGRYAYYQHADQHGYAADIFKSQGRAGQVGYKQDKHIYRSSDQGYDIHEIAITYFGIFADGMTLRNPFPDTLGDRDKDYVCQ